MNLLPTFPATAWRGPFKVWRDVVEDVSVCPLPYHFANLLSILSAQMGDFAVLDEGVKTFLNFFVFSYGRTGTKKSTAMDLANEHIVERLSHTYFKDLSAISSAEGLIRTLATEPYNVRLHYDEVKHLFSVASRSGSAIEPVLNKAFGLGKLETVVRKQSDSIAGTNYFFNLIVNGTPVHISLDVGEAMFHGGLLNRFLVFAAVPNGRVLDHMGRPDEQRCADLASKLDRHVSAWRGFAPARASVRVGLNDEAQAIYRPWYERIERRTRTQNELIADPIQRIPLYAKKVAAIFCLFETVTPCTYPKVTAPQMKAAIDVVNYCEASILYMSDAWGAGAKTLGARSEALAEQRIEVYLQENGCTTERELAKRLHMSVGEAKRAVFSLASVNVVSVIGYPPMVHHGPAGTCDCFKVSVEPEED